MKFDIFKPLALQTVGKQAVQEDCIFPELDRGTIHDRLFIVADGQGGEGRGDVASAKVCAAISDNFFQNTCSDEPLDSDFLDSTFERARQTLLDEGTGGTASVAVLYFHRQGCLAAHVGNCRVYHVRPRTGQVMYKSRDSLKTLADSGTQPTATVKAHITDVQHGDYFLLLSKGAVDTLFEKNVVEVLCSAESDETKLARLRDQLAESRENSSLYLVHVSGVMTEAIDTSLPDNERQLMAAYRNAASQPKAESENATHAARMVHDDQKPTPERKRREFPIVWVTAASLVLIAALLLYFGQRKTETAPSVTEEPQKEVKKPAEKDTFNVMKGVKDKASKEDLFKDEKKKEEEIKKEKEAEKSEKTDDAEPASTVTEADIISADKPTAEPVPSAPVETPATEPAAPTTPPADASTVTPRPVIPED